MKAILQKTPYDLEFSVFRIPVRIHPLFWVVCVLLGGNRGPLSMSLWTGVVLLSLLTHELAHALASLKSGIAESRIVLYGIGGVTMAAPARKRTQRIQVSLAGPVASVVIGLFALVGMLLLARDASTHLPYWAADLLESAVWVNLVWGLGNLLPVIPLDGGRMLEEAAAHFRHWKGRELAARISFVCACGLSVLFLALRLWFAAVLFAFLAWNSLRLIQEGGHRSGLFTGDGDNSDSRRPWERDFDWWKS